MNVPNYTEGLWRLLRGIRLAVKLFRHLRIREPEPAELERWEGEGGALQLHQGEVDHGA